MAYNPNNPNGQATMANSAPVVVASNQSSIPVNDDGGSITVDGTVAVSNFPATQPVSGTITATQSGTWNITNISGTISLPTGAATETTLSAINTKIPSNLTVTATRLLVDGSGVTQPVSGTVTANISGSISNTSFAVTQATAASLNATVVGTGTFAVQAAQSGTWNVGTLTSITNTVTVSGTVTASNTAGDVASGSADSGNPVKVGLVSRQTLPTSIATGSRTNANSDRYGRQLNSHIDPGMQIWKSGEYTTAQTGTNIWVPTAGNRFVVTQLNIATGGTTAGLVTIWGAQTATTVYAAGTDQVFFRGSLTPTANATPGALIQVSIPLFSDTTNDCLKITTSANMTVYVQVYGYEITP